MKPLHLTNKRVTDCRVFSMVLVAGLIFILLISGCETTKPRASECHYFDLDEFTTIEIKTQEEVSQIQQKANAGDAKAQYNMQFPNITIRMKKPRPQFTPITE